MKCEICEEEMKRTDTSTTLLYCEPHKDEQGRWHYHDRNTSSEVYVCKNGHKVEEKFGNECWCGWKNA